MIRPKGWFFRRVIGRLQGERFQSIWSRFSMSMAYEDVGAGAPT
jgi:hypothetical protein